MAVQNPSNIVLIGMPGSGKSTFGVSVAQAFTMAFVDTDDLIEAQFQQPLQVQLDEIGYLALRQREADVIASIDCQATVIATGGSAVYGVHAMAHLREIAHVVYLQVSEAELLRRIDNLDSRGIAKAADQSFSDMMLERVALYERYAHITVCAENPDDVPIILQQLQALR